MIETTHIVKFPIAWNIKREPARAPHLRFGFIASDGQHKTFDEMFDWHNMWYDGVRISDTSAVFVGPPLYGCAQYIKQHCTFNNGDGSPINFEVREYDRVSCTILTSDCIDHDSVFLHNHDKNTVTELLLNSCSSFFDGCKVMVTQQTNSPIEWITQWIQYHHFIHGIEGFLIYDNNSTQYTTEELFKTISRSGVKIKVVSWPFTYGPKGSNSTPWDSDFAQYCMLEHAKQRYLRNARLVMHNDVDELVVTPHGSIDDIMLHLHHSSTPCFQYSGRWIEPYDVGSRQSMDSTPLKLRRYDSCYAVDSTGRLHADNGCGTKWMLIPELCINKQWRVHSIDTPMLTGGDAWYAHYLSMNVNPDNPGWKRPRDRYIGSVDDLKVQDDLFESLRKAFNVTS
jgi:Glycosyl transferase family 2